MKYYSLLILLSFIVGCTKSPLEKTSGSKLLSIQYEIPNKTWEESYTYDNFDRIIEVVDGQALHVTKRISYTDGQPYEVLTSINNNELLSRDSFIYNDQHKLSEIYKFTINPLGETLQQIMQYKYDDSGRITQKLSTGESIQEFSFTENYIWDDNNIVSSEVLDNSNTFQYGATYSYDDKENWTRNNPNYIGEPAFWSANNVIKTVYDDGNSLIDRACQVCSTDYKYNLDGYPVEIVYDWGSTLTLEYE